jgi:hypothetical protein
LFRYSIYSPIRTAASPENSAEARSINLPFPRLSFFFLQIINQSQIPFAKDSLFDAGSRTRRLKFNFICQNDELCESKWGGKRRAFDVNPYLFEAHLKGKRETKKQHTNQWMDG